MIDQHVTSLELSKQLYEAGIVVESEFWWCKTKDWSLISLPAKLDGKVFGNCIPAPLSSELGELLPIDVNYGAYGYDLVILKTTKSWFVKYEPYGRYGHFVPPLITITGDTEANARAKMLLYLKEKGLL